MKCDSCPVPKKNPYARVKVRDEAGIHQRLRELARQIRHCIVQDCELLQYVQDFYEHVHVMPSMIEPERYPPWVKTTMPDRPLIVHAPTSAYIKGTDYILKAIDTLREKYTFDFRLIQGCSHEEAKKWYAQADLVIDQMCLGSYGLLSVECMAMGKPVVCWITDYMKEHYPKELPIISANPDTLAATLASLLDNRDALPKIGRRGRAYVEQYHDVRANIPKLLAVYQQLK